MGGTEIEREWRNHMRRHPATETEHDQGTQLGKSLKSQAKGSSQSPTEQDRIVTFRAALRSPLESQIRRTAGYSLNHFHLRYAGQIKAALCACRTPSHERVDGSMKCSRGQVLSTEDYALAWWVASCLGRRSGAVQSA